jgi:hypothetical protein
LILLGSLALAAPARAHPAPAEPPLYAPAPCIKRADANAQDILRIDYAVAFDDVLLDPDDIPTPDARTHQFFALRGAVVLGALGYELVPFEATQGAEERIVLPTWLSMLDLERAKAATEGTSIMFDISSAPANALLDTHPALTHRVQRIDADDARRPITSVQAELGVGVPLAALERGSYTIAAYIFSPPFNGWAPMPGLVNVVRETHVPAAQLESVAGVLRGGQGRAVRACVDAPEGSTVRGTFFTREAPERGWQEFAPEQPLENETIELCFRSPDPALSGTVRVRLELRAPDGSTSAAYSPDTLTALAGDAGCEPSATACCLSPASAPDAGASEATTDAAARHSTPANCAMRPPIIVPSAQPALLFAGLALLAALRLHRRRPIC